MPLSARNQLPGTIEEIKLGSIMAHVIVRIGDYQVESVITRTSAEELNRVIVKSTEAMIAKD